MKTTLLKPEKCDGCLFFESHKSPYGTQYNCRYYNKSSYSNDGEKYPFCRVECILVTEKA